MTDDMKNMMYMEMKVVQQLNEEMKRKFEESASKIDDHFHSIATEVSEDGMT
jgi:chromosome segregation ATPase